MSRKLLIVGSTGIYTARLIANLPHMTIAAISTSSVASKRANTAVETGFHSPINVA
jgi:hypothetical protein